MLEIVINITMQNSTSIENSSVGDSSKTEIFLCIIMIKLTLLFTYKLFQMCTKLYQLHNKKVIGAHMKNTGQFVKARIAEQQQQNTHHLDTESANHN